MAKNISPFINGCYIARISELHNVELVDGVLSPYYKVSDLQQRCKAQFKAEMMHEGKTQTEEFRHHYTPSILRHSSCDIFSVCKFETFYKAALKGSTHQVSFYIIKGDPLIAAVLSVEKDFPKSYLSFENSEELATDMLYYNTTEIIYSDKGSDCIINDVQLNLRIYQNFLNFDDDHHLELKSTDKEGNNKTIGTYAYISGKSNRLSYMHRLQY
jgi:hypothetical protein